MNMSRFYLEVFIFIFASSYLLASVPEFQASVDKTHIKSGESIVLTLEYSGTTNSQPDFSLLRRSFDIESQNTSSETQIINGHRKDKTLWQLEIIPKIGQKNIEIPKIMLGKLETSPIAIAVIAQDKIQQKADTTLEAFINYPNIYINQQLLLTFVLRSSLSLRRGKLDDIDIPDVFIESLGEDMQTEEVIQGKKYIVITRKLALFPTTAGKFIIPVVRFKGRATVERRRSRSWPFFASEGRLVQAQSQEIIVNVKDVPAAFPSGHTFLPVKHLTAIESFDQGQPEFEINKAFNISYEIRADGALPMFIADLKIPRVSGVNIYSEKGKKNIERSSAGIIGVKSVSHVFMPVEAREYNIPGRVIYWWDVDTDALKETTVGELKFSVVGDDNNSPVINSVTQADIKAENSESLISNKEFNNSNFWLILTMFFAALWLITVFVIFIYLRVKTNKVEKKLNFRKLGQKQDSLKIAVKEKNTKKIYQEILLYLRKHDVKNQDKYLYQKIMNILNLIEQSKYCEKNQDSPDIIKLCEELLKIIKQEQKIKNPVLDPLYPND